MDWKDIDDIRIICRTAAAENAIRIVATVIGESPVASVRAAGPALIRVLEASKDRLQALTLPDTSAEQSDLLAAETQLAYANLLARLRPLLDPPQEQRRPPD